MAFELYSTRFPREYCGCCRLTPTNNQIGANVVSIVITGFEYTRQPTLRDMYFNPVMPLDVAMDQTYGALVLRVACGDLPGNTLYIETYDSVKPTVFIGVMRPRVIQMQRQIRGGFCLWKVVWE